MEAPAWGLPGLKAGLHFYEAPLAWVDKSSLYKGSHFDVWQSMGLLHLLTCVLPHHIKAIISLKMYPISW